jgi:hypothetical protein
MLGGVVAGAIALAVGSGGAAQGHAEPAPASPAATVRAFLNAAFTDRDPVAACEFFTPGERNRVGERSRASLCQSAISGAARRGVRASVVQANGRRVTVRAGGREVVLRLVPVPRSRRPEELAPASGWRIASGAGRLLG